MKKDKKNTFAFVSTIDLYKEIERRHEASILVTLVSPTDKSRETKAHFDGDEEDIIFATTWWLAAYYLSNFDDVSVEDYMEGFTEGVRVVLDGIKENGGLSESGE